MTQGVEQYPIGNRSDWLERRRKYLNASDMACAFGLHDYKTLARLTAEKRGLESDVDPDSPLIRRGNALEDDARDEIQKLHPSWRISRCEHQFVDPVARIACTPDFLVVDPDRPGIGSLQTKVVSQPVFKRKWPDGTPPLGYLLQLATEMMLVPDCTWGALGALIIGDFTFDAKVFPVDRNAKSEIRLRTAAAEFWRAFDAGDQPVIDFERDGDLIALMFPTETPGKIIDLSTDNAIGDLLERRQILKDTEKDITKRLKACEDEIKHKIGDAEGALVPGWRLTWKLQNRAEYTAPATSYRVLRVARNEHETKNIGSNANAQ
jgi:predicted phage-related endonuclease